MTFELFTRIHFEAEISVLRFRVPSLDCCGSRPIRLLTHGWARTEFESAGACQVWSLTQFTDLNCLPPRVHWGAFSFLMRGIDLTNKTTRKIECVSGQTINSHPLRSYGARWITRPRQTRPRKPRRSGVNPASTNVHWRDYFVINSWRNQHKTAGNPADQESTWICCYPIKSFSPVTWQSLAESWLVQTFVYNFLWKKKVATKRSISWIHALDKTATGHSDNWFGNRLQ